MLSDWESDLTDLSSSDEEEYVPPSQKKKTTARARNTGNDYKVTNTLRPPRTTQYTAKSLFDQMMDNTIDLDPEYQRDIVWSDSKQSGLIDSILRNYYIPPVIFAVTAKEDGSESRTCIDGKQRLTSIANFFNGVISHRDSKTNTRYWYKDGPARGVKRKILPKQYQQVFANKQITCVEYEGLTDDQEREIFQRVQLGVALTPAERLQALTGHRATLIREIQVKVLGSEGFGSNLEWANGRGRDFQCLASIVYLIEQQSQTFPHVTQLEKWLQSVGALPVKFESDIMETFQVWVTMVRDVHFNTPFSKPTRVSPIEFTIIGVLIHKHRSTLSMLQLSNAISQMRADVRSQHVDIRANSKVTKTMLTFINKKMKTIDIQGDGKGDISATTFVRSKAGENGTATGKRKRAIVPSSEEEESSDDEDDVPLRRKAPAKKKAATTRATTTKSAVSAKPAVTSTSSKTAATKTTIKLPARSAVSKPATPASTAKPATSASKVTVKQVTVSTSAKSAKTSPTVSQSTSTVKKKEPSATTAVTGTPTATPTMPSKAVPAAEVTQVKSSPNTTSPAPLALPRRTPLPNGMAASGSRSASVSVKTEPGVEAALQSPTVNRGGGIAASPLDRLAAIRAAKANIGSRSVSGPAAVPAAGRSAPAAASLPRTSPPNILDNVAPIVKQERPQLSNINTNVAASIHQQPPAAQPGPSSTSSSRLPTPALPPPSTVASSARSTPSVSTPTGLPAPPVHIQQTTGKQPSFDAVYLGDLFKEHRIGIYAHQAFPPANQPQAQLNHQPTLPASAPNGSTAEDVVMGDATSRAASVMPQLSTEQVLSTIPPHVLSAIQLAQQSASAPPFPNNGMPTAPPVHAFSSMPSVPMGSQIPNEALKRSPSTPAPAMPPTKPAAMRTPPPIRPLGPRPPTSAAGEVSTSTQFHPSPSSLPPPPPSLPPPPPPGLPPPPPPTSPSLSVKSAGSGTILARPMSEHDGYNAGRSVSPRSSLSRGRAWGETDWDMDRNRDRDGERSRERGRDRDRNGDSRWAPERPRDPRRRDSGGTRNWEQERTESRDWGMSRRGRGRERDKGWPRR